MYRIYYCISFERYELDPNLLFILFGIVPSVEQNLLTHV